MRQNVSDITAIIPARLHSTRLPRKVLLDINGKAMVHHVYDNVTQSGLFTDVIIATDHEEVITYCKIKNLKAVLTDTNHLSGTDRIAEVAQSLESAFIVNIQADEPFLDKETLSSLIELLVKPNVRIGTLCHPITDKDLLFDYNTVKVVKDISDKALLFSRQAIPAQREKPYKEWLASGKYYQHIGLYGFERETLLEISKLTPSSLEKQESLEQLRWLENGYDIHIAETKVVTMGIDTQQDLDKARKMFSK